MTCGLALTHATELGPAVAEIARVVRPGGHVVHSDVHPFAVETGGAGGIPQGGRLARRDDQPPAWVSDYVRAFVAAGLAIERCEEPLVDEGFKPGWGPTTFARPPTSA